MKLIDCPVGLFLWNGVLCLKTEYFSESGGVEAYIVSSGERFWGGVKDAAAVNTLEVTAMDFVMGD